MPNLNKIIERAEKSEGDTQKKVKDSLKEKYPDYRISKINDLGDEWEVELTKLLEKKSASTRTSEFPPSDKKEESEPKEDSEEDKALGEEDSESEESEDSEGGEKKPPFGDKEEKGSETKDLKSMIKELLVAIKDLESKAGLVDEIHNKIKPHVEEMGLGGGMGEDIGPTAPGGGNPGGGLPPGGGPGGGMSPGGPGGPPGGGMGKPPQNQLGIPSVPRRPNIPSPRKAPPQRGIPSGLSNVGQKIVFSPIIADDKRYSISEAIDAFEKTYPLFRVARVQEDLNQNRFVGTLVIK